MATIRFPNCAASRRLNQRCALLPFHFQGKNSRLSSAAGSLAHLLPILQSTLWLSHHEGFAMQVLAALDLQQCCPNVQAGLPKLRTVLLL